MLQKYSKSFLRFLLMMTALVVAFTSCGAGTEEDNEKKSTDIPVRVEKAGTADISIMLSYSADLKASTQIRLLALMTDRILSFPWKDGDEVSKGDVIAVIKKDAISAGLAQIDAQAAGLDVQIANLKVELDRVNGLFAKGVATQQSVDQLSTQYSSTRAQRKALNASRRQLAINAGNAVVKAPADGVLSARMYEEGDIASPQMPLATLLITDPIKVELKLVERDISKVSIDQVVDLHLDAYPARVFQGSVARIFPYVDAGTRTNTVEVMLPNPRNDEGMRLLKPGMFGKATLLVERREGVVVVPEPALLLDNKLLAIQKAGQQLRKAYVVDSDGIARERTVLLGAREGSRWEIQEGINAGEIVVVRGQHGLTDGRKVSIVSDQPAAGAGE